VENIIKVQNLSKIYQVPVKQNWFKALFIPKNRDINAVNDISFNVKEGETVAFLGPNGAGKTTTLKMLSGLLYPSSGTVGVLGYEPTARDDRFLSQIALVMGNKAGLSWDLTPNQNYELFKSMYEIPKIELNTGISQLSEMLGVSDQLDTPVRKLSLGQRMKFELIGGILHRPKIMFLDEPTIGLDVIAKRNIRDFLRTINKEMGTTLILTSHDMADIEKICDRVIIINHGKLIYDDYLDKLTLKYRDKKYLTVTFEKKVAAEELSKYGQIISSKELSHVLEVERQKYAKVMADLSENYSVDDIDVRGVPLDEIMEDMFK